MNILTNFANTSNRKNIISLVINSLIQQTLPSCARIVGFNIAMIRDSSSNSLNYLRQHVHKECLLHEVEN